MALQLKQKKAHSESVLNRKQAILSDLYDLLRILAVIMILYMLFFRRVVVSGPSMYDTLKDGDQLLLLSSTVYTNPRQGDVVVASKKAYDDGKFIIKRIVAAEGQTVDIDFAEGVVYVDGIALDEEYTYTATTREEGVSFPLTVPDGCFFVMGDNRDSSMDSRSPQIGFIDEREIVGKAIFLLWPGTHYDSEDPQYDRIGFEVFQ